MITVVGQLSKMIDS